MNIKERYERYSKQYDERAEKIRAMGFEPYMNKYTQDEYLFMHEALKNTRKEEGRSRGNINRDIVSAQMYEPKMHMASAKAIAKETKSKLELQAKKLRIEATEKSGAERKKLIIQAKELETEAKEYSRSAKNLQRIRLEGSEGEAAKSFFDDVLKEYYKLRGEKGWKEASKEISRRYYGSPD